MKDRGFGRNLGFGTHPALLVVDVMNAFTDRNMPLGSDLDAIISPINTLLEGCREVQFDAVSVFFTVVSYGQREISDSLDAPPTYTTTGLWFRKMKGLETLREGTPAVEIDPRIQRDPEDSIIVKKYASAFFGTDLVSRLNSKRVDTLIIAGCTTSGCIRATAVDAIQYGYIPIVVREAVADRSLPAHEQSLKDLQMKYADVVLLNEVMDYLKTA